MHVLKKLKSGSATGFSTQRIFVFDKDNELVSWSLCFVKYREGVNDLLTCALSGE